MARPNTCGQQSEILPVCRDVESILAFRFDEEGKPSLMAEFNSEVEKLALLFFAQNVISEFGKSTACQALARGKPEAGMSLVAA